MGVGSSQINATYGNKNCGPDAIAHEWFLFLSMYPRFVPYLSGSFLLLSLSSNGQPALRHSKAEYYSSQTTNWTATSLSIGNVVAHHHSSLSIERAGSLLFPEGPFASCFSHFLISEQSGKGVWKRSILLQKCTKKNVQITVVSSFERNLSRNLLCRVISINIVICTTLKEKNRSL